MLSTFFFLFVTHRVALEIGDKLSPRLIVSLLIEALK
jgi:hypothetical protein